MTRKEQEIAQLNKDWSENPRWRGIRRGYTAEDVIRLRGSVKIEHTLAKLGAEKLWKLCNERPFVNSLGALTGNQRCSRSRPACRRSTFRAGRSRPTPTIRSRCTRTSRCTRFPRFPRW